MFRSAFENAIAMNSRVKTTWQDQNELNSIIELKIAAGSRVWTGVEYLKDEHYIFLASISYDLAQLEEKCTDTCTNPLQKKIGRLEDAIKYLNLVVNKTAEVKKILEKTEQEFAATLQEAPEKYQFKITPVPRNFKCKIGV